MASFSTIVSSKAGEHLPLWLDKHKEQVTDALLKDGAVLLRDFDFSDPSVLVDILASYGAEPMQDARWSSPRSAVGEGAFTASEYPPDQTIVLHSEMSYARLWPRLLVFQCAVPANTGGATTVCNIDALSADLSDLLEEFLEREVLYVRNFRSGVDIPWQNAFGTDDRSEVNAIGREHQMETEWLSDGTLRTHQLAQGAVLSENDEPLLFNQAHLFHPSQLSAGIRDSLVSAFGVDGLPRNAVYGDGEPIAGATIDRILNVLKAHTQPIAWQAGDIAIIDNMRWLHGRAPFSGDRSVFVAMGMPHDDIIRAEIGT